MNKKIAGLSIPLFFILPWLGFILSFFDFKSKRSAFIYVAFAVIFGYAISFSDSSADSYRYAKAFSRFNNTLDYNRILQLYRNGELRDLYQLLLFYITSLFTDNPKVLFSFAGFVYGIFSYLNLRILLKECGNIKNRYVFVLALVFFTYCSLSNINGFKFWTGAMILFYSCYNFIIQNKIRWVIGIIVTPFIHYGFMLIVPLLVLYRISQPLFRNKDKVKPYVLYAFIATFSLSWFITTNSINLGFLTNTGIISGAVGERIDYVNSSNVAALVESRSDNSLFLSVQNYFNYGIKIYVFICVLYLYKLINKIKGEKTEYINILSFVMFFYSFAFIAISFPSGSRFFDIAHLFLLVLLGKVYKIYRAKKMKNLILWMLPVFSFNIAFVNFMLAFLILTPKFWYANFFWIIIDGLNFYI